jgi:L,D-peptidoglycan transpeptidase YkuD (ErfK/YbiS/YcfS/YnhG family)
MRSSKNRKMKFIYTILLFSLCTIIVKPSLGQWMPINKKEIIQLIKANKEKLNNVEQLVIAINNNDSSNKAIVVALERVNKKWKIKLSPVQASIGRTGFALPGAKIEGDGKSPTGVFAFGQLYTYEASVNTTLPFTQTNADDKWIDDPNHENYNTHIRGNTTAKSFEHLKLSSIDYKYCMVIEYNTQPVVKGKGSAIFFHLADANYSPTAGCVAIQETDMDKILLWLDPNKQKAILMGNKNHLQ